MKINKEIFKDKRNLLFSWVKFNYLFTIEIWFLYYFWNTRLWNSIWKINVPFHFTTH